MIFQRKYNTATVAATHIRIPIIKRGVVDFAVGADWTPAAGDVTVSKDGGTAANIATLPTALTMGNTVVWVFELSAAELSCKQLVVSIADATTKTIEDSAFVVETFGNASAMYPRDVSTDNSAAEITAIAEGIFKLDLSTVTGEARRSMLNAIRKLLNRWTVSGGTLTVYKEDDSTSAYTETTTNAAGNPITGSDPN